LSRLSRSVVGTIALIGPMGVATAAFEHSRHGDERKGSIRAPTAHSTPMDALAEAILAFSPEARSTGSPTIAMLRAKASQVRWTDPRSHTDKDGRQVGTLAGGTVTIPRKATVPEMTFEWYAPEGQPLNFNPVKAFRNAGFKVQALYCASMISDGTNYFVVSAPGKRPGFLSVYAFDAPTATSVASWSISYRLDGYIPSLAEVQNGGDLLATSDCSTETFGRVEQISHPGAVALMKSMTLGSGTRAPR
jgi:hypothetical protein